MVFARTAAAAVAQALAAGRRPWAVAEIQTRRRRRYPSRRYHSLCPRKSLVRDEAN